MAAVAMRPRNATAAPPASTKISRTRPAIRHLFILFPPPVLTHRSYSDTHIVTIFRLGSAKSIGEQGRMRLLRTPDERFADLPDWPFAPRYCTVIDGDGTAIRLHYVDEGPPGGPVVVLLHGEPSWAYLYRKVIAGLAAQ